MTPWWEGVGHLGNSYGRGAGVPEWGVGCHFPEAIRLGLMAKETFDPRLRGSRGDVWEGGAARAKVLGQQWAWCVCGAARSLSDKDEESGVAGGRGLDLWRERVTCLCRKSILWLLVFAADGGAGDVDPPSTLKIRRCLLPAPARRRRWAWKASQLGFCLGQRLPFRGVSAEPLPLRGPGFRSACAPPPNPRLHLPPPPPIPQAASPPSSLLPSPPG